MNPILRLDTQTGRQTTVTVRPGQRVTLAAGDLLKLEIAGVQSLRQGTDLVLLIPSDQGGAPVRVVVAKFFASSSMGMVQLGEDGQTELLTSQSSVPTASQSQANGFSDVEQSDGDVSNAMVMRDAGLVSLLGQPHDLRIADTQGFKTEAAPDNSVSLRSALSADYTKASSVAMVQSVSIFTATLDVEPPAAPTVLLPSSAADVSGEKVLNRLAVLGGVTWMGKAEPYSVVTLTCKDAAGNQVSAKGETDGSGQWRISMDGAGWLSLTDGQVEAKAVATDASGNTSLVSSLVSVVLHKDLPTPPTAALQASSDTGTSDSDKITSDVLPKFDVTTTANHAVRIYLDANKNNVVDTAELRLEDTADAQGAASFFAPTNLSDGVHRFLFSQVDEWGNESTFTRLDITVDTTAAAPVINAVAGDDALSFQDLGGASANTTEVPISGTGAEALAAIRVVLTQGNVTVVRDTTADAQGLWQVSVLGSVFTQTFSNGTFNVSVTQTDAAGNLSAAGSRDVALRNTPLDPITNLAFASGEDTGSNTIANATDKITNHATPKLVGQGPADMTVRLYADTNGDGLVTAADVLVGQATIDSNGQFEVTLSQLEDGAHTLLAQAYDPASRTTSLTNTQGASLAIVVDTQVGSVTFDTIAEDNVVVLAELTQGVSISGHAEANALVTVKFKAGGTESSAQVTADGTGAWQRDLTTAEAGVLGDGQITVQATQTDAAGNTSSSASTSFTLIRSSLQAPTALVLDAVDDTGSSSTDGITKLTSGLTLTASTLANASVTVFDDINRNGALDSGETLVQGNANGQGVFQTDVALTEGVHLLRTVATDSLSRTSSPSVGTQITVDSSISNPANLVVAGNNKINAAKASTVGAVAVSGTGDAGAELTLVWTNAAQTEVLRKTVAAVPSNGTWSWVLSASELASLPQGSMTLKAQQTDVAGNTSAWVQTSVLVDTVVPNMPTLAESALANTYNSSAERAWSNGLSWSDIFSDTNQDGTAESHPLSVAVALSADILADDIVKLNWGGQTITQAVVSDDLTRGYVLVSVDAASIVAAGVRSNLALTATFTDAAGNEGGEFIAYSGMNVTLDLRAPILEFPDAHANTSATANDEALYTNFSTNSSDANKHYLSFTGQADPDSRVTIFIDTNLNGVADVGERVLATAQADSSGVFNTSFLNNLADGAYNIRSYATIAGQRSAVSDVVSLHVDTAAPAAPVITQSTLTADNIINASERDAGVTLSGTAEPYATLTLNLENNSTGVVGSAYQVQVAADGTWSRVLSWSALGQVGDGTLKVLVKQTDLAGNDSASDAHIFTLDTQVALPTLKVVAADDKVNAIESLAGVSLNGGGEVGATVYLQLRGSSGTLGPLTVPSAVNSNGVWTYNLSTAQLTVLGQGDVSVDIRQIDAAGNTSALQTQIFKIDTQVAAPTLGTVAGNDRISAAEETNGITLTGQAEAGAMLTITLKQTGVADEQFNVQMGSATTWSFPVPANKLSLFNDGTLTIDVLQTDAAGNVSTVTSKTVTMATEPLVTPVTFDAISGDNKVSLAEQTSNVQISGHGPAQATLSLALTGKSGSVSKTVMIDTDGVWHSTLTPTDMTVLGQGEVAVRASARNADDQSTAVATLNWTLDAAEPSPSVGQVSGNAIVNAAEALASVALAGTGVVGHVVSITITGANLSRINRSVSVGSDGRWQTQLSEGDFASLGEGSATVEAIQKSSSQPSALVSVPVTTQFLVDTVAPSLPSNDDQAYYPGFNSNSQPLLNGVTVLESQAGVVLSVPKSATAAVGDVMTLSWGTQKIQHTLTQADMDSTGPVLMTVSREAITTQGSGVWDVQVVYTDAAGNSSAAWTLVSGINVTAPPQIPQIDTVSTDGFVNAAERSAVYASHPLVISGTASGSGTVVLTLVGTNGQSVVLENLVVSGGVWSANLSGDDLDSMGEGRITMSAVFTRADGAVSLAGTGAWVYDRTAPSAPTAQSTELAGFANATSELSGGLIRLNGAITEAANDVQVRVALPSNASGNDLLTLYWGGRTNGQIVTATVNQTAINQGYLLVTVPSTVISTVGDSNDLLVQAMYTDKAGNNGALFNVWNGRVDAVPLAPSINTPAMGEWLNLAEATAQWGFSGSCQSGGSVELTLVGAGGAQLTQTVVATGSNWSFNGFTLANAQTLGAGTVTVSALQRDADGNPSANAAVSFKIDLIAPNAPVVASVSDLTYGQTQNGASFSGTALAGATVTLDFVRGSNHVYKTVTADDTGAWTGALSKDDFAALALNTASGTSTSINATQADLAGNVSTQASRTFNFSNTVIAPPAILAVTGLDTSSDAAINSAELASNGGGLTLSGTGIANQSVRLTISVTGVPTLVDVAVGSNGAWSKTLTAAEVTALGQGVASLTATSRITTSGVLDESVSAAFTIGSQNTFVIDTVAPSLVQAGLTATGLNGNAKAGDKLDVIFIASENLQWNNTNATLTLNLGGQTRTATFDASASRSAANNRLVFSYTVQAGDNASAVTLGSLNLNGTQFVDAAGNPAGNTWSRELANSVVVDTTAPSAPSITSVDEAADGSKINVAEATAAVHVQVSLTGTGAIAGDSLMLKWNNATLSKLLSSSDIAAGVATVFVSQSTIGAVEANASLTSWLIDQSGNRSSDSATVVKPVDTVAPSVLTVATWMTDDRISKAEADASSSIAAISGGQVEAGASVRATMRWGDGTASDLTVTTTGQTWSISAAQLQSWIASHTDDGKFTLSVWQVDAAGNPGNITQKQYYVDRSVPLAPTISDIGSAADGWINKADATAGVTFAVSLANTQAIAGDQVLLSGLGSTVYHEITAAEITAGSARVTVLSDNLLQANGAPVSLTNPVTARIEDQGGNLSTASVTRNVKIDTNVVDLTVSIAAGTAAAGVSPLQSSTGLNFEGSGAESGATLKIVLTGALGNVLRLVPTVNSDGTFTQLLKPSDFTTLGDGVVSYELAQTDPAGNTSSVTSGAFNVTLTVSAPVLNDFAGDNIVGSSEVLTTQTLSGTGVVGASVAISLLADNGQSVTKSVTTIGPSGAWSVNVAPADFATLLHASTKATVSVSATASYQGTTSTPTVQTVQVVTATPTLGTTPLALFDANRDGANNDGFLISFSEAVRVSQVASLASSVVTVSGGKSWGAGARIEAVSPTTSNGALFASQYKIYLGTGSTIIGGDTIKFLAPNVVNAAQNAAASDLQISVPSLVVPAAPTPPLNVTTDNLINATEKAASTAIAFKTAAATAGSTLGVYRDGVFVKSVPMTTSSTSTSISLTGSDWGSSDGQHTLSVQVTDAAGHASAFSAPKSVVVDTGISAGMQSLRLLTDTGVLGSANTGDVVRVTFNEVVGVSAASLPASVFGTGATVAAVTPVNGKSAIWDITLGTSPTLASGQVLTFINATDNAGNTGSVQNAVVPSDVYNTPSLQIATVTTDNVINATERNTAQAIALNLKQAKTGDVVKLFMDGISIGTATVGADGQTSINVSVSANGWGADGERVLSASITRGATTTASLEHSVYVNADSTHWSAVNAGTLWFDPDTLVLTDGAQVTQWDALTGKTKAGAALSVYSSTGKGAVLKTTDASGHVVLYFNGSSILGSNAFIDIPDIKSGYADFSMFKQIVPVNTWAYTMTRYLGNGTTTPYRHHFGTAQGYGLTSHFSGDGAGYLKTSPLNSTSINNWMILNGFGTGSSINVALDGNTLLTRATTSAADAGITATKYGANVYNANYALMIGGTQDGFVSGNGSAVTALMGDQIAFNTAITAAQRGEVATYLAAKYLSTGTQVLVSQAGATYDLSVSSTASVLVNDMLQLQHGSFGIGSDMVITAGADYVNTGAGDDTVLIKDLAFRTLDGGRGSDKLKLDAFFSGDAAIILADFVSNARGFSGNLTSDTRVNAAGFHKLQGFEAIDLSTSNARQVLTVAAADVNQLSDGNTLEVQLGLNDVLVTSGFTSTTRGIYSYNNNWYDQKALGTVDGQAVTLYSRSGDQAADINSFKKVGTSTLQLNFDHAMVGTPMVGDFSVSSLNGSTVPSLSSVSTVNLRQGLSLNFATAVSTPIKVIYSGTLTDEGAGRSVLNKAWMIGTDGSDVLDATSQTQGLTMLGGAGSDLIKGSSFSDVLLGGLGADTITGGAGSDTFKYVNEVQGAGAAGGLGGKDGDVITDFDFGRTDESQADSLDLSMLFDSSLAANGDVTHDVSQLVDGKFMDIVQTRVTVNGVARKDWEVWVDRDGGGNYQRMVTLQGAGDALPSNYAGNETTSELLQKLLTEGRLTVAHI